MDRAAVCGIGGLPGLAGGTEVGLGDELLRREATHHTEEGEEGEEGEEDDDRRGVQHFNDAHKL